MSTCSSPSTSTQRTYRYVRLGIIGAVAAIFVSLIAVGTTYGWPTSISALYYTPGSTVFVGALFAVTLGLLALSGHSVEQALLDLAAVVAPLIAIVPTVIDDGRRARSDGGVPRRGALRARASICPTSRTAW